MIFFKNHALFILLWIFIKEKTIDFCKNQTIKGAILQSVDLLKTGKYDQIKSLVDNAMKVGAEKDIGHDYAEDIEERFSESARVTVETPWTSINEIMDGGLGPGELGVFVAPAGVGKTWGLVNVGVHALQKGLTVIQITDKILDLVILPFYLFFIIFTT